MVGVNYTYQFLRVSELQRYIYQVEYTISGFGNMGNVVSIGVNKAEGILGPGHLSTSYGQGHFNLKLCFGPSKTFGMGLPVESLTCRLSKAALCIKTLVFRVYFCGGL